MILHPAGTRSTLTRAWAGQSLPICINMLPVCRIQPNLMLTHSSSQGLPHASTETNFMPSDHNHRCRCKCRCRPCHQPTRIKLSRLQAYPSAASDNAPMIDTAEAAPDDLVFLGNLPLSKNTTGIRIGGSSRNAMPEISNQINIDYVA